MLKTFCFDGHIIPKIYELEKYRGIGTLEEVEEAVEKRKAKRISMHVNESDLKVGSVIFRKGTKSYKC